MSNLAWRQSLPARRRPSRAIDWPPLVAVALLFALAVTWAAVVAWLLPALPILPFISLIALTLAGTSALFAWILCVDRRRNGFTLWDTAGALALIGFGSGMLSDPESIVQLFFGNRAPE
jgi:hypothetical protein